MKKATKEATIQIIKDKIKNKDYTVKDLKEKEYLIKRLEVLENARND